MTRLVTDDLMQRGKQNALIKYGNKESPAVGAGIWIISFGLKGKAHGLYPLAFEQGELVFSESVVEIH